MFAVMIIALNRFRIVSVQAKIRGHNGVELPDQIDICQRFPPKSFKLVIIHEEVQAFFALVLCGFGIIKTYELARLIHIRFQNRDIVLSFRFKLRDIQIFAKACISVVHVT